MKIRCFISSLIIVFAMAALLNAREILVGISPIRPPFMYVDENDEIKGYDPDIARAVLKKLGHTPKFVNMTYDGLIPSLITGKIEMIASGLSINDERKKKIDFSDYYNETGSKIAVLETSNIKSLKDLKGKKVGAEIGTVQADFANENAKKYGYKVVIFNAANEMFLDLIKKNGGIDAMIENEILALNYNKTNNRKVKVVGEPIKPSKHAFGIQKDNEKFVEQVNDALKELRDEGGQQRLHELYFGF
ncbi:MAG: transporter substrate-binding domain-containing protein [Rickettsiales bacterium]|jgi:ABC-type amino acid transport substrate-binding protein|nr:transporter substrate-binding domain-containing protein [Rickettsiales bacterium]